MVLAVSHMAGLFGFRGVGVFDAIMRRRLFPAPAHTVGPTPAHAVETHGMAEPKRMQVVPDAKISALYPSSDPPVFITPAGETVAVDCSDCHSTADARAQVGAVSGKVPQCVNFISASGAMISDEDVLTVGSEGCVTVVLDGNVDVLLGRWRSEYGPHGLERQRIEFDGRSLCLRAWKITGDPNVPAGYWTWRTCSQLDVGATVKGFLQVRNNINDPNGFSEAPGNITAISEDEIIVNWHGPQVFYRIRDP